MEYLKDDKFIKDFVDRTIVNLNRCEKIAPNEVTLFLNSLIGLLIIPEQKGYKLLDNVQWDLAEHQEFYDEIVCVDTDNGNISLQTLARHLRNAIAHFNIEFGTENGQISTIVLYDGTACKNCTQCKKINCKSYKFHIEVKVDIFKKFVIDFAQKVGDYFDSKTTNNQK